MNNTVALVDLRSESRSTYLLKPCMAAPASAEAQGWNVVVQAVKPGIMEKQMKGPSQNMEVSHIRPVLSLLLAGLALATATFSAMAEQVSREQDIVNLRLGQRILVDDGSCPAGQIKEVLGAKMTANGVLSTRKCVPRLGTKR
jgi:uncharacterized protein DUF6719